MLEIGGFRSRLCQGVGRRAFLRASLAAPFAWGLSDLVQGAEAVYARKAKSVILVWLWGAPCHLDLVDPKPNAPAEYRGPLSVIPTRTPGVYFTELLPLLAARTHLFSLVRSNQTTNEDHLVAGTIALTAADQTPQGLAPNFGSILARHRGYGELPPFISLGRASPHDGRGPMLGYGGGKWGKAYDPFLISCSDVGEIEIPALKIADGMTPERLGDRRLLLSELDRAGRQAETANLAQWDRYYQRAYGLLTSPEARKALDLSREDEKTRHMYGQTSFGQSCLLARRLAEAEVPYIQVNWSHYVEIGPPPYDFGWDTHAHHFDLMLDRHGPIFDRAFSALLDDLDRRGLLKTTLVVAMGEFGRTPRINPLASRDHWAKCYFSIWAGGGVQPGRVVGASDPRGIEPVTEPITPRMVGTTMLELAGVHTQVRAELRILEGGRVIDELL